MMDCPKCGYAMSQFDTDCPRCKRMQTAPSPKQAPPPAPVYAPPPPPAQPAYAGAGAATWQPQAPAYQKNTSGTNGPVPLEVANMGFSWGAFGLGWIWGVSNKIYFTLGLIAFGFIPHVGPFLSLGAAIWLGVVGHRLAWRHREFASVEQFRETMRVWNTWGVWLFIGGLIFGFAVGFIAGLTGATS